MANLQTTNSFRRTFSILVVLFLLGVFLSIYFLKYVPDQKSDYNRRAFQELGSVIDAFNKRDSAYLDVVKNFHDTSLKEISGIFPDPALPTNCKMSEFLRGSNTSAAAILDYDAAHRWSLFYTLSRAVATGKTGRIADTTCTIRFQKPIDAVMLPLIRNDVDVFDSYLMILDKRSQQDTTHWGEVIFNPGELSVDYAVNIDTLLKKSDGFSLPGINDVKLEGNDYKLFLRPFRLHGYKAIMAGLLSRPHYIQRFESVPIGFITTGAILLVLLLIALPIVKIFILGAHERLTGLDLRMIIGAYFVGAFALFFLYTWNFLKNTETRYHKDKLAAFAANLQTNLTGEIHAACTQLRFYDSLYRADTILHRLLTAKTYDPARVRTFETNPANGLHPKIYKQFDAVFWVDNDGKVAGRYGLMHYHDIPLISLQDREYFQNMKTGQTLALPGYQDNFCLQPTLDKLDGRFVMNIVIPRKTDPAKKDTAIMLGLSGQPYSVYNTALPSGFGYSIVDNRGTILFDSRAGRHLLSNIYTDIDNDNQAIAQCLIFRKESFFGGTTLHGNNVSLLVTPVAGLPYTVLAYYDLDASDKFQLHILGLSCFFIGGIILLLIFSAFCNEWARSRTTLLRIPEINFQWLRPRFEKIRYYLALSRGMLAMAGSWALIWIVFEFFLPGTEFFLFAISVLLPFYLAIHYFLLRERQDHSGQSVRQSLSIPAMVTPVMVILVIMIYLCSQKLGLGNLLLIIGAQLVYARLIAWSSSRFHRSKDRGHQRNTLPYFAAAAIIGIVTAVVIPAAGIFGFFYKEETRTKNKEEMLAFATTIAARRDCIAMEKDSTHYSLYPGNPSDRAFLDSLKYRWGVYYISPSTQQDRLPENPTPPRHHPSAYYTLRNFLYPGDTTIVTFGDKPDMAGDSSWYFQRTKHDSELLVHTNVFTGKKDSVRLPLPAAARSSAMQLLFHRASSLGASNIAFFILSVILLTGLFFYLTKSLAIRLFLLRILNDYPDNLCREDPLKNTRPVSPACPGLLAKMQADGYDEWSSRSIREFERKHGDFFALYIQNELKETYRYIWTDLSPREKFVLYDFAIDDLANYRSGASLFSLIRKGILYIDRGNQLHFMTRSFHDYVLNQSKNKFIIAQMKQAKTQGSWENVKLPFLLIVAAAGIFVFLTQDAVYQKITGLLTSLGSIVPVITQFFDNRNK